MSPADDLEPDAGRVPSLIDFARSEGWHVGGAPGKQLRFSKPGQASIYTRSSSSDAAEQRNDREVLRGSGHDAPPEATDSSATTGSDRPQEVHRA